MHVKEVRLLLYSVKMAEIEFNDVVAAAALMKRLLMDGLFMHQEPYQQVKIGILGGGQLGRMLIQSGMDWNISFSVLDP